MSGNIENHWITALKGADVEFVGLVEGDKGIVSKKMYVSRTSEEMDIYYFLKEGPKSNGSFIAEEVARKMIKLHSKKQKT